MDQMSRRDFINRVGWGVFLGTFGGAALASIRFLSPNILYEPPKEYKVGFPKDYSEGVHFIPARRIFVIRKEDHFQAISAICTHLGCTVRWDAQDLEYKCPCHGSIFNDKGGVIRGPAARPLPWYGVSIAADGRLLVDQNEVVPPTKSFTAKV